MIYCLKGFSTLLHSETDIGGIHMRERLRINNQMPPVQPFAFLPSPCAHALVCMYVLYVQVSGCVSSHVMVPVASECLM